MSSKRRIILAAALSVFALLALAGNIAAILRAYWLPPDGLTGGRVETRLRGGGRIEVEGGFVREVGGDFVLVRSTAPETLLRWRAPAGEACRLRVQNVNPDALDADAGDDAEVLVTREGPNEVALSMAEAADVSPVEREIRLRLAPIAEESETRFFVYGAAREGAAELERLIAQAGRERPDFIVSLGDHYYRAYLEKIENLDRILASSTVPVYLTTGDDDRKMPKEEDERLRVGLERYRPRERFKFLWGDPLNAFAWRGLYFVLFENSTSNVLSGKFAWLEKTLRSAPEGAPVLLFAHVPPFDPRGTIYKNVMEGNPGDHERLRRDMGEAKAAAAFFSHYGGYFEKDMNGTPCYVIAESGARQLKDATEYHFLDVTARGGEVRVERRPIE